MLAQAELTLNASKTGFINWTFSATCDGLTVYYSGSQFVHCH